ncbi:MAG: DUF1028 domain-containing protein, partial [Planctomycetota bacterium]|nr:DUF1028 domain-containing protein [Planctomycetota bacterium]
MRYIGSLLGILHRSRSRRLVALWLAVGLLVPQASATWSVVVINKLTGEVCSATATCIEGMGLENAVPVIVVGRGAGASQAFVLSNAQNRKIMFSGFKNGLLPDRILDIIIQSDSGIDSRQFGIVSFDGPPSSFTGAGLNSQGAAWAGGLTGETSELIYAIQGNSLTGANVILAAEQALLNTSGDLSLKVMMAMEAARSMGGDGRCSCSVGAADSCGSPPPSFDKSAHQAVMFLARPGDKNGSCQGAVGCANGDYYLGLKVGGNWSNVDPVIELRDQYAQWRASLAGVPDHYLSEVSVDRQSIVADGRSRARVTIRLKDLDGVPLTQGGALINLKRQNPLPRKGIAGPVTDNGDGTYSLDLVATTSAGLGQWRVDVDLGGPRPIRLSPFLELSSDPLSELHVGVRQYSGTQSTLVPFTLNRASVDAGRPFRILGSLSGTQPGFDLMGVHVALNRDLFFNTTWVPPGRDDFYGSHGSLDAVGRAQAYLRLDP